LQQRLAAAAVRDPVFGHHRLPKGVAGFGGADGLAGAGSTSASGFLCRHKFPRAKY
jgi:hypothetical protein